MTIADRSCFNVSEESGFYHTNSTVTVTWRHQNRWANLIKYKSTPLYTQTTFIALHRGGGWPQKKIRVMPRNCVEESTNCNNHWLTKLIPIKFGFSIRYVTWRFSIIIIVFSETSPIHTIITTGRKERVFRMFPSGRDNSLFKALRPADDPVTCARFQC